MADQRISAMFYRQFSDNANSINNRANIIARSNDVAPATGPGMVQSIQAISDKDKAKEAAPSILGGKTRKSNFSGFGGGGGPF